MRSETTTTAAVERPLADVRRASRSSRDPRAARTRSAILTAVEELTAQGIGAPSVSEIVTQAGISRSSFYTQFASVEELTAQIFGDALEQSRLMEVAARRRGRISDYDATKQAAAQLVEHVAEHRELYRLGLPSSAGAYLTAVMGVARQLEAAACVTSAPENGVSVHTATTYLAGGMLAVLHAWVTDELTATNEQIVDQVMTMLPAWIAAPAATGVTK